MHSTKTTSVTITETCKPTQTTPSKTSCIPPSHYLRVLEDKFCEEFDCYDWGFFRFNQTEHGPQGLYDIIWDWEWVNIDGEMMKSENFLMLCSEEGLAWSDFSVGSKAVYSGHRGWCATSVFKYDCNDSGNVELTPEGLICDSVGIAKLLALANDIVVIAKLLASGNDSPLSGTPRGLPTSEKAKTTSTGAAHPRPRKDEL